MLGAIIGDIVGSRFEFDNWKHKEFDFFAEGCDYTDDTICTIATADWILHRDKGSLYQDVLRKWCLDTPMPKGGYGQGFLSWIMKPHATAYNSWGNGAAMRVTPIGWAFGTFEETMEVAKESALITHNHPEGIKGAQAVASAVFLAREGASKSEIKSYVECSFGYDLRRISDEIRLMYTFNESCQETVPEAIIAFLESSDFEDAIRIAISLGGDSDTLACITGGIAEAYYGGVPNELANVAWNYLPDDMKEVVNQFYRNLIK